MNSPPGKVNGQDDALAATGERKLPRATSQPAVASPTIPDYELLRPIGGGAYGEVWLARNKATGALRAAKIVWRHTFEDDRPFRREFEGIQRFEQISREHPSQLALFHIGRNDEAGYFYYLMELADNANAEGGTTHSKPMLSRPSDRGEVGSSHLETIGAVDYSPHTLRAELAHGRLSAARALEIAQALAEALSHLHRHGLVHRDVKPSNVIFVNGRPKLADIGLVTDASDQCSIVGTEGYLPPEGTGTPQADIFALGKVLYETVTGMDRRRFPELPKDLREWPERSEVIEFNEIVLKSCAKDLAQRYQSADEMRGELALLQSGKSVKRRRAVGQRWKLAKKIVLAAIVLAVVVASGLFAFRELNRDRPLSSNLQAKALYDRAVYELQGGTLEALLQAYTNLTEAIKLDPRFIDAYFMLSEVYIGDSANRLPPQYNRTNNYRWALDNLRKVSPDSAQYHTANSLVKFWEEGKFEDAIAEVERAVKLNPNFQRAHTVHGWQVLHARRDAATARAEFKAAQLLGGADVMSQMHLGTPDYVEGNYKKAIEEYQKASWSERRWDLPHFLIARAYEADKQYNKALEEYETFEKMRNGNTAEIETRFKRRRSALAEKGPRGLWQAMLDEQNESPSQSPYNTARLYARLGNTNEAFVWLEKASQEKNGVPGSDPLMDDCWDPFRDHPKYKELLEKKGFTRVLPLRR